MPTTHTGSFTADALLRKYGIVKSFTAGAFLKPATTTAKIEIWYSGDSAYTDVSGYLWAPSAGAPVLSRMHALNQPQQLAFQISNGTSGFRQPVMGNRVRVTLNSFADQGPYFFTGYLTQTPALMLLGGDASGNGIYGYACVATDESQVLEWKAAGILPTVPPFLNQYQGTIIKALLTALGASFDVTHVANGAFIPYFATSASEGFWQCLRRLCDNTQSKFWITSGEAYFSTYGDAGFGYSADETNAAFDPTGLTITPIIQPTYNDVIGFGGEEPTTYCVEYFCGDGLTASFTLKNPMWTSTLSTILEAAWTSGTIDGNVWNVTGNYDPNGLLSPGGGSLHLFGGASVTPSYLIMNQGIELSGTVTPRAGRFNFWNPTDAIIGALINTNVPSGNPIANVLAGFRATISGSNTVLQPIVNGAVAGPTYTCKPGLTYELTVTVDCPQLIRTQQSFFSWLNSYGGAAVSSGVNVSFCVEEIQNFAGWQANTPYNLYTQIIDYDNRLEIVTTPGTSGGTVPTWPNAQGVFTNEGPSSPQLVWEDMGVAPASGTTAPKTVLRYSAHVASAAQWMYYMIVGGPYSSTSTAALLTCNFTYLSSPLYIELFTKKVTDSGFLRYQIGDKTNITARAAVVTQNGQNTVQFFQDMQPNIGEILRIRYRSVNISRARVQNSTSVAAEAVKAGDNGIRSGILPIQQQLPRNSAEIELAAKAYIDDHTGMLFQGAYQWNTKAYAAAGNPVPGRFMTVNAPSRYPSFSTLVNQVKVDFIILAGALEFMNVTATYGPLYRLDEQLKGFNNPVNAAAVQADTTVPINPLDYANVGTSFSADRDAAVWDGTKTASTFELDTGAAPDSYYELRKTDYAWGTSSTANFIERATTQVFTITRNAYDTTAFLKNVDSSGRLSRYPTMVRLVLPLPPTAPLATLNVTDLSNPTITIDKGILQDPNVFGFEIRGGDNATVLYSFMNLALQVADLTVNLSSIVNLSSKDPAAKGGFSADAVLVTRNFQFYVYTKNLLGEYSSACYLAATIPTPTVYNLSVDETSGKLIWTVTPSVGAGSELVYVSFSAASRFKVEVATDSGYTNVILTKVVSDRFLVLDDENMLRQRYFRVTPGDAIGWGTPVTTNHVHTPATPVDEIGGGGVNNSDNIYSVPAIPTPTTDITPPSSFSNWSGEIQDRARQRYVY